MDPKSGLDDITTVHQLHSFGFVGIFLNELQLVEFLFCKTITRFL